MDFGSRMKKTANAAIGPVAAVTNHALWNASISAPEPTIVTRAATPTVDPNCRPTWFSDPPTAKSSGGTSLTAAALMMGNVVATPIATRSEAGSHNPQ